MRINEIKIEGVGGVKLLDLSFDSRMNLLCGPNGVGKTTILESIAHIFMLGRTSVLKRNVASSSSKISVVVENEGCVENKEINFDVFMPEKEASITGLYQKCNQLISLKITRTFQYKSLQSVSKDINKEEFRLYNDARDGISLDDVKNWFVNRYLYSAHQGALSTVQFENFELAKKCLSLLNENFSFNRVDASSNEIMINTPNGEIYYEYLSSGFKSIISILFGIIKEIEFRFKEYQIKAEDFNGVILIDEIELHLHPEWQEKIVGVLLNVFPKAQFFASTHSPHIIQAAELNQIIALGFDGDNVIQRILPNAKFGFQGWTIEEILNDVMGMGNLRTSIFNDLISQFDNALEDENVEIAESVYRKIDDLLHPENTLRKLLKFQLAGLR